jgi:polysaccharide export outer membrane protein
VERRLLNRAIEPKVVATLVEQHATLVSVVGEVNSPRKVPITQAGERILDMIALAGGIRFPGYEIFVTLQRGKNRATVYFNTLVQKPDENIYARPGDVIYIYREPRRFLAFGAVGSGTVGAPQSQQFNFGQERVSLAEGVGLAGGLIDNVANPAAVFLYRVEPRRILEAMSVDLSKFPPQAEAIPTVYRANLRDPSSYFAAQQFPMRMRDIIYVSNAQSVEVTKFLGYVTTITSSVSSVANSAGVTAHGGTYALKGFANPY